MDHTGCHFYSQLTMVLCIFNISIQHSFKVTCNLVNNWLANGYSPEPGASMNYLKRKGRLDKLEDLVLFIFSVIPPT